MPGIGSYRRQSLKYGDGGRRAFNTPDPYKPNTKPKEANDNARPPANDNFRQLTEAGRRIAETRYPLLRYSRTALDLWRFAHAGLESGAPDTGYDPWNQPGGWVYSWICPRGPNDGATHVSYRVGSGGAFVCPAEAFDTGALPIGAPPQIPGSPGVNPADIGVMYTSVFVGVQAGQPVYKPLDWWSRATPTSSADANVGLRLNTMPNHKVLPGRVVISPDELPILQPIGYPLPIPLALAPYRANDPIGSQRNNGDRRDPTKSSDLVGPPPRGTKEAKLNPVGSVGWRAVRALHHATTEGLDLVDVFHDALPKKLQAKATFHDGKWWKASPQAKVEAVWKNFDQLDWSEVGVNAIKNEIEDRILGRANAKADRALNNSPIGRITRGIAF